MTQTLHAASVGLALSACSSEGPPKGPSDGRGARDAAPDAAEVGADVAASSPVSFQKIELSATFYGEGASIGDFDRDGVNDVVSGPFWYEGPDFTRTHAIYEPFAFDPLHYSDNFFAFVHDFNRDEWPDVLVIGFPGRDASWFENPGEPDSGSTWLRHVVFDGVDAESPTFVDVTGDGLPEIVCAHEGRLGWVEPNWATPSAPWTFRGASAPGAYAAFTHGLGVGDVDGDGRADLLEQGGVWLQPSVGDGAEWSLVPQRFGDGGAQMFALDVDDDGDSDVVTTWWAHGYGLSWFERGESLADPFSMHEIAPSAPPAGDPSSISIHEPHALEAADINGDGLTDLVTGERFWGHVPESDRDFGAPASIYWFELVRPSAGPPRFVPHLIDDASGVGTQVVAGDIDGDGRLDLTTANKRGAFVFLQQP